MQFPGLTDYAQQFLWIFQPALPGLWYFIGLQAVGKLLLIFMDMEDNTRRAASRGLFKLRKVEEESASQ
jgi:hypothetical protein